jgi:hypothetical protein
MKKRTVCLLGGALAVAALFGGCVERKLTIKTEPQDAVVFLNDEEIGVSPVTVSFQWYGEYRVRIEKQGYETLKTYRSLAPPLHDHPPFDFFAQNLWPDRIVDSYEWTFTLSPQSEISREQLIENAEELKEQLQ